MKHTAIAGTDLVSSSLSLGGVALGSKLNEEDSFRLMDEYAANGGNMIDTAQVYANWLPVEASVSEKTIGKWMKARQNRQQMIVTTKGAHPRLETMRISRMSPGEIVQDVEDSLKRLQVDTIDLYWLHRDDPTRTVEEILETLNGLVNAGKIRYFGCSNWRVERIKEAQDYASRHHIQGFSGNQMMWSLASVDRAHFSDPTLVAMDKEMKQYHLSSGLIAIPYSSQAQGLFTKLHAGLFTFDDEKVRPIYRSEINRRRLESVRKLAADHSLTATQVVLGYLLSQPFATIPIIGCYTAQQLKECLQADRVRFTAEELELLEMDER